MTEKKFRVLKILQTLQYMVQIKSLEIVCKDKSDFYGTSQKVASVVSPSEEYSIEKIMVHTAALVSESSSWRILLKSLSPRIVVLPR